MSKIKIAIVGVGSISGVHIKSYLALPDDYELYAFCDINETRLKAKGEKYGVTRLYTDEAEMLADLPEIDAVDVCTWNAAHAPCAIMALNAGKHVFCEKPMAMTAEEAIQMKEAADRNGKLLMIGFVRRFGRDCEILKDFINGGTLGDIYYAKAHYLRRNGNPGGWFGNTALSGGGPLIDLGVHVIDLARYVMGNKKPVSVYGVTYKKLGNRPNIKGSKAYVSAGAGNTDICDCEDFASALIRFEDGSVISVEASFSLNIEKDEGKLEFFGDKGGAKLDVKLTVFTDMNGYLVNVALNGDSGFVFDKSFRDELKNFADAINGKAECRNPAEDGIEMMKILRAVYKSAELGHEIIL